MNWLDTYKKNKKVIKNKYSILYWIRVYYLDNKTEMQTDTIHIPCRYIDKEIEHLIFGIKSFDRKANVSFIKKYEILSIMNEYCYKESYHMDNVNIGQIITINKKIENINKETKSKSKKITKQKENLW